MEAIIERVRRLFGRDDESECIDETAVSGEFSTACDESDAVDEAVLAVMSREFSAVCTADKVGLRRHICRLREINDWIASVEDRRVRRAYRKWVDFFAHDALTRLTEIDRAHRIAAAKVSVPVPPSIARANQGATDGS